VLYQGTSSTTPFRLTSNTNPSQALNNGGENQYIIYDSRAAVYERLGNLKDALKDTKKTIGAAPERWQGYARAARLFLKVQKPDSSMKMVDMALIRVSPGDEKKRLELASLKETVGLALEADVGQRRSAQNHSAMLPVEIFGEMANFLLSSDPSALITLLHVSRSWRNIVWSTSTLWHTLVVTRYRPGEKVKLWVERSKGRIRELRVLRSAFESHWGGHHLDGINWEALRICKVQGWHFSDYLHENSITHILANLDTLEVDHIGVDRSPQHLLFTKDMKVQHLTLRHVLVSWQSLSACIRDLKSLTLRNVHDRSNTPITCVLEANPLLETLVLDFSCSMSPRHNREVTLDFSYLTRLELANNMGHAECILQAKMPQLQVLSLQGLRTPLDGGLQSLTRHGSVHLTDVILRRCSVANSNHLISFLESLPLLENLELSYTTNVAHDLLQALAPEPSLHNSGSATTDQNTLMCPSLTHLNLSHCPEVKTGPLVRLVKSRQAQPQMTRIMSLTVDGCDHVEADWIKWFREKVPNFSCVYLTLKAAKYRR
jgi:F-box/TPR repeat protein Pof3